MVCINLPLSFREFHSLDLYLFTFQFVQASFWLGLETWLFYRDNWDLRGKHICRAFSASWN